MAGLRWGMAFTAGLMLVGTMTAGCGVADFGSSLTSTPTPGRTDEPTPTPTFTPTPEPTATLAPTPTPTPSEPVLAQVNMPTAPLGYLPLAADEFSLDDDTLTVFARVPIHLLLEGERIGAYSCSLDARFFVDDGAAEHVLIYKRTFGSGPVLPRDVIAEFPYTRTASHADWYELVDVGATWKQDDCGDFIVTYGQTGILFKVGSATNNIATVIGGSVLAGSWRVIVPDITFQQEPMVWDVAPPSPAVWLLELIFNPMQP